MTLLRCFGGLAVTVLTACSMTVVSPRFPDVSIECVGDPGLAEDACRAWGEEMLRTAPVDTTRLELTYRTGNARCAADYLAGDGRLLMSSAARCPSP